MVQNINELNKAIKARSDGFLAYIAQAAEEDMLEEFNSWERNNPDLKVPKELESRILNTADEFHKKQKRKQLRNNCIRFLKMTAIIMLVVAISFSGLLISAEAFRLKIFDFIFENNKEFTKVVPVESGSNVLTIKKNIPEGWQGLFYPGYLPEGYLFAEAEEIGDSKTIVFKNKSQAIIILTQGPLYESEMRVNNEGVESGEVLVDGSSAFWTSRKGEVTLIWNQNEYGFLLYGPENLSEMIKIAEELLYIK